MLANIFKLKMITNLKGYCPLIFNGIYVERGIGGIQIAPCSLSAKSSILSEKINFESNTHLTEIRDITKLNQFAPQCQTCWVVENNGGESKRQTEIDAFKLLSTADTKLMHIDYNTLPICNAKCIICSSKYSSLWIQDDIKLGHQKNTVIPKLDIKSNQLKGLDLSHLRSIYFNGGEPLLTNDHINLLSNLENLEDISISYNTNGSCYPTDDVIKMWNRSKEVTLFFSIDGINDKFEYIRNPLIWEQVSNNIKLIHQLLPNVVIGISYTLGIHNVFGLQETINWFTNNLDNFNVKTQFHVHTVNGNLDLCYASPQLKHAFNIELKKFDSDNFYWLESIQSYISSDSDTNNDWQTYLSNLDNIRNNNWKDTFKDLCIASK